MKTINANTKIAAILKQDPDALEAIISLSPRFTKLRNPLLRKLMAGRASVSMASKIGGCTLEEFFNKLIPLGFTIDRSVSEQEAQAPVNLPAFLKDADPAAMLQLDVRSVIDAGEDPLNLILEKIRTLRSGQILKLINSFEPVPLVLLLEKQGFESHTEMAGDNLVHTFFHASGKSKLSAPLKPDSAEDWDSLLLRFKDDLILVDVRQMEMPLPMLTILEELDKLPEGKALFIYHKRIPVFLLPELADRHFGYRVKELGGAEVHMLIFRE